MKVISIFCTAILLVVGLSDMVKADTVNIQYEGKITYGASTVGSFHVDGIRAFCMGIMIKQAHLMVHQQKRVFIQIRM